MSLNLKHQLSEGNLYRCFIQAKEGKTGMLKEELLVIANNAEEARDKAEDWFRKENPGAKEIMGITSETEFIII